MIHSYLVQHITGIGRTFILVFSGNMPTNQEIINAIARLDYNPIEWVFVNLENVLRWNAN